MLYQLSGFPEEDEIVLCKVANIFPNSVFVDLIEYGKQGMVHISEIAPGRIRNLRDYVVVNKQIVCKVLKVDPERGHVDLSLRRVSTHQRKEKLEELKQELKAEILVKNLSKKMNLPMKKLYQEITEKVFKEYSHLFLCFKDVSSGEIDLEKIGLEKKLAQELTALILEKFKTEKIIIKGEIKLQTYSSEGVDKIKKTLLKIETVSPTIKLFYLGGGKFKFALEDAEYKSAEKSLKKIQDILTQFEDKISTAVFEREKE